MADRPRSRGVATDHESRVLDDRTLEVSLPAPDPVLLADFEERTLSPGDSLMRKSDLTSCVHVCVSGRSGAAATFGQRVVATTVAVAVACARVVYMVFSLEDFDGDIGALLEDGNDEVQEAITDFS